MKYAKMLGLLAVAAAALMAFAGTASATQLTSPEGTVYTGEIKAESVGATSLHGSFTTVTCQKSTVAGKVESHGTNVTTKGNIYETGESLPKTQDLTFSECNFPVKVLKSGFLEIHTEYETITDKDGTKTSVQKAGANRNGTLTSTGAEVTIETSIANCLFTTSGTDVGTLTGASSNTGHAVLDINSAGIPRTGHSIFCGGSGIWTGSYKVTTPTGLIVD